MTHLTSDNVKFFLSNKTSSFNVAVGLYSNRSQWMSKYAEDITDILSYASCFILLFLSHCDVICDILLTTQKVTWNLFFKAIN